MDAEVVARSREDEVKMLGVGVAKRLEKVRSITGLLPVTVAVLGNRKLGGKEAAVTKYFHYFQ